ncbi:hypothetical protein HDU67_009534 [Dinochytrium kinnereticum]|nr:hypothetical protein HDU67_009534 [Dinochytrium kinnereticum]
MLSQQLTGKFIEGIWHTSVVVFGKEIYFGQGIQIDTPGTTMHGQAMKLIDMGETGIPESVFWEYIDTLREYWTADKYHLFDNNCNSFSKEVCLFLVGKPIPEYISDLPKEFLSTKNKTNHTNQEMFGPSRIAAEHQPDLDFSRLLGANQDLSNAVFSSLSSATSAPPAARPTTAVNGSAAVPTPTIMTTQRAPILFSQCSQLDKIFGKLEESLVKHQVAIDGAVLDGIRVGLVDKFEKKVAGGLKLPAGWENAIVTILDKVPDDEIFPALDILRLMILDNATSTFFIRENAATIPRLLYRLGGGNKNFTQLSKATRLMVLRLACNLFATDPSLAHYLSSKPIDVTHPATPEASASSLATITHRSCVTALLVESLLCEEQSVRQGASSLAFNMAARALVMRAVAGEDALLEEWECELVAAVVKALEGEGDHENLLRLLSALGLLLFERSESLISLAEVLDTATLMAVKRESLKSFIGTKPEEATRVEKIRALTGEIASLMN